MVSGHVHLFDVVKPRDEAGNESDSGIRQFIVGNGGGGEFLGHDLREERAYGVLKLTLRDPDYEWEFLPVNAGVKLPNQKGVGTCNAKPVPK